MIICSVITSVLIALTHVGKITSLNTTTTCSRSVSRKVRDYLQVNFFDNLSRNKIDSFPIECPLNPHNDLFLQQEEKKRELSMKEWQVCFLVLIVKRSTNSGDYGCPLL
jgi:hypothetical protein